MTNEQITGIEALHTKTSALIDNDTEPDIAALISHIPALCATVRAGAEELAKAWKVADELRAENDRLSTGLMNLYHVITNEQCDRKVALGMATSAVSSLQSQLEQLQTDVNKFSTLADERHDLLSAERRANDSLRQHVDESMRTNEKLTARNVELRQQLAQVEQERDAAKGLLSKNLHGQIKGVFGDQQQAIEGFRKRVISACRERAREWGYLGLSNTWFAGKEEAANELAAEFEKL